MQYILLIIKLKCQYTSVSGPRHKELDSESVSKPLPLQSTPNPSCQFQRWEAGKRLLPKVASCTLPSFFSFIFVSFSICRHYLRLTVNIWASSPLYRLHLTSVILFFFPVASIPWSIRTSMPPDCYEVQTDRFDSSQSFLDSL